MIEHTCKPLERVAAEPSASLSHACLVRRIPQTRASNELAQHRWSALGVLVLLSPLGAAACATRTPTPMSSADAGTRAPMHAAAGAVALDGGAPQPPDAGRSPMTPAADSGTVVPARAQPPAADASTATRPAATPQLDASVPKGDASRTDASMSTSCSGPVGTFTGELASGIRFLDDQGAPVNAHGGGILREGDTFYLHGELFSSTTTDNDFNGFSMYSSKDLTSWHNEGIILPRQPDGELGPKRKGERPHIIRCPDTGEFVLYAHAASSDYQTDREVVYATSMTVTGQYQYRGPLENASGQVAAHSDMSAYADETGAYVLTEGGHVYTLSRDCHSWLTDKSVPQVNGDSGGSESPTVFKAKDTYYWIGSYKTGWRANNDFYATAAAITGPWTYRGFLAPVSDPKDQLSDERTWLSQSTWVQPVSGCAGTVYVYWGDHWDGNLDTKAPGKHNALATYVFQPLVFDEDAISLPSYHASWKLDVGAGTWSP